MALGLLEIPHVLFFFPAAASDAAGFAWYLSQAIATFMALGVPVVLTLAVFEDWAIARIDHVNPAYPATFTVSAILAALLVETVFSFTGVDQSRQFPERVALLRWFFEFAVLAVVAALAVGAIHPAVRYMLRYTPNLRHPRVAFASSCLLIVCAGVVAVDFALFSVHLEPFAIVIVGASALLLILAVFCVVPRVSLRAARGGVIASGLVWLLQPIGPWRDHHARFVTANHSPLCRSVTVWFDLLTDFDGDHAASRWWGGTDCDDGDPHRNPMRRETPDDGVDQDCSGKDSVGNQTQVRLVPLRAGCSASPDRPSILLISLDALRASAVRPEVMPNLALLGTVSTTFNRAYTAAPDTINSVLATFSGRPYTDLTSANPIGSTRHCASEPFTRALQQSGYRNGFFCLVSLPQAASIGFDDVNPYSRPLDPAKAGLFVAEGELVSAQLTNAAMEYIEARGSAPYFLWVHYTDTHAPYNGPPNIAPGSEPLTPYETTAAYADFHIGRLLRFLEQSGRGSRTVVVVTADHGEDLGQRGKEGHGPFLFEESIHVPLILRIPGCPSREVDAPVSLTQLGATLASFGGARTEGLPLYLESDPELPVVAESLEAEGAAVALLRAFMVSRYKLIVDVKRGGRMLFDLAEDPEERHDIYRRRPEVTAQMEQRYQDWLDRANPGWTPGCTLGWRLDGGPLVLGDAPL